MVERPIYPISGYIEGLARRPRIHRAESLKEASASILAGNDEEANQYLVEADQDAKSLRPLTDAISTFAIYEQEITSKVMQWLEQHNIPLPVGRVVLAIDSTQTNTPGQLDSEQEQARKRMHMDQIRQELGNLGAFEYLGPKLDSPIIDLDLYGRACRALRRHNITIVREILGLGVHDLLNIRDFGDISLDRTISSLAEQGYIPLPGFQADKQQPDIIPATENQ